MPGSGQIATPSRDWSSSRFQIASHLIRVQQYFNPLPLLDRIKHRWRHIHVAADDLPVIRDEVKRRIKRNRVPFGIIHDVIGHVPVGHRRAVHR